MWKLRREIVNHWKLLGTFEVSKFPLIWVLETFEVSNFPIIYYWKPSTFPIFQLLEYWKPSKFPKFQLFIIVNLRSFAIFQSFEPFQLGRWIGSNNWKFGNFEGILEIIGNYWKPSKFPNFQLFEYWKPSKFPNVQLFIIGNLRSFQFSNHLSLSSWAAG